MNLPELGELLVRERYVADRPTLVAVHLAMALGKPLLVEGRSGVGKTELGKVLASGLGTELIRLQCYEGLDASTALYEWNFPKQVLRIKLEEQSGKSVAEKEALIFSEPYLLERPILRTLTRSDGPAVLLVDEVDRADEEFEALLLEVLSEFQVTIPELGTIKARHQPVVVLTSNRTRELGDALRRRCLYLWLDYPTADTELAIIRARVPEASDDLAAAVVRFVGQVRQLALDKAPGVAETLDWLRGLMALGVEGLAADAVAETLGLLVKAQPDLARLTGAKVADLLANTAT